MAVSSPPATRQRLQPAQPTPARPARAVRGPLGRLREFWFGSTDLAPVAAFRIVFGVLLFNWFWQLFPNMRAFFTDDGMLPRSALLTSFPVRFNPLAAAGDWWPMVIAWVCALVVAAMVTVGYRTRLALLLAFLAQIGFQARNPLILDGSDLVFRLVPFWLLFTACGELYSVDALRRRARGEPTTGFGPALPVRLLEVQVAWIYLATALEKWVGSLWHDGTAVYYALQLKHTFGRWWAEPLVQHPAIVRGATWGGLYTELMFLPLVFSPIYNRLTRVLAVLLGVGLHGGILVLMNVGNFPVVMLATLILFLPPATVRRGMDWLGGRLGQLVGLVSRRRWPRAAALRGLLHPAEGAGPWPVAASTNWAEDEQRRPGWWAPRRRWAQLLLVPVALAAFATAIPEWLKQYRTPEPVNRAVVFASLDQRWDMFSPNPAAADGWLLAPAKLTDGTEIDLITGGPPNDAPRYADPFYTRWTKVTERIAAASNQHFRLEYGRMYCRLRNWYLPPGQSPLATFQLIYVERIIQPPGQGDPILRTHQLWNHEC